MKSADFDLMAKRLETWIAPEDVISAVNSLAKDSAAASKPATLILSSPILRSAADGGFDYICKEYLQRFCMPAAVIALLKNIQPSDSLDAAWMLVENVRFAGAIGSTNPEATGQPHSVLQITDKEFLIDILVQPLKGLLGMVAASAETWRKIKDAGISPQNIHHRHRMPEPFAVWLDAYVAGQYGFADIQSAPWLQDSDGHNFRYRAITIHNYRHSDQELLMAIKAMAVDQANSTLAPLWMVKK